MRAALLLLALLPALALAQGYRQTTGVTASQLWSSAEKTLYVDSAGNDSNACTGSGTAACSTLAGALRKLPRRIRHPIVVNVASGTYAGATLDGFTFETLPGGTQTGSLRIVGTLTTYTPTSGSATFSFSSQAASTSTSSTFGTMTTAETWPDDELAGKLVEATSGGGVGTIRVIAGNAGGVITLVGPGSTSANTSTVWTLRDWGTTISAATFPSNTLGNTTGTANWAPFNIGGIYGGIAGTSSLQLARLKFAGTRALYINGPVSGLLLSQNLFATNTNDAVVNTNQRFPLAIIASDNVFNTGTRYGLSLDTVDGATLTRNSIIGGLGFRLWTYRFAQSLQNHCKSSAALACENWGFGGYVEVRYGRYLQNSSNWPCLGFSSTGGGILVGAGSVYLQDNVLSGCGGSGVYAIGPVNVKADTQTGTGNGRYGFEALRGAQIVLGSGNTVTGASGDTAVGPTPTVTAYGAVGTGVSSTADFSRISP